MQIHTRLTSSFAAVTFTWSWLQKCISDKSTQLCNSIRAEAHRGAEAKRWQWIPSLWVWQCAWFINRPSCQPQSIGGKAYPKCIMFLVTCRWARETEGRCWEFRDTGRGEREQNVKKKYVTTRPFFCLALALLHLTIDSHVLLDYTLCCLAPTLTFEATLKKLEGICLLPCRYISSPSANICSQRAQRAHEGW